LVTGLPVADQTGFAVAPQPCRIKDRPVFHLQMIEARQVKRAALAGWGKRQNKVKRRQIIAPVFHFIKTTTAVAGQLNIKLCTYCN